MDLMKRWQKERKDYVIVNEFLEKKFKKIIRNANIKADVTSRVKKDLSLKRKIIRKGNNEEAYNSIIDKSGLRIICCYISDLNKASQLVESEFEIVNKEDKRDIQEAHTMGYQAIHLDIKIKKKESNLKDKHLEIISEVQIKTALQSAFGENSHDLTYKNIKDIPPNIKRRVNLLNAIIEVADNEFCKIYEMISEMDSISVHGIFYILVEAFYNKFKVRFNSEFTLFFIEEFFNYYKNKFTTKEFSNQISEFISNNYDNINYVFNNRKANEETEIFFLQPEMILIYFSLLNDKNNFVEEWNLHFNFDILNTIASWFGISVV